MAGDKIKMVKSEACSTNNTINNVSLKWGDEVYVQDVSSSNFSILVDCEEWREMKWISRRDIANQKFELVTRKIKYPKEGDIIRAASNFNGKFEGKIAKYDELCVTQIRKKQRDVCVQKLNGEILHIKENNFIDIELAKKYSKRRSLHQRNNW